MRRWNLRRWILPSILSGAAAVFPSAGAWADEGAAGHYLPGSMADFLDMLPEKEGFAYANFPVYYQGFAGITKPLDIAGDIAVNVNAAIYGDTSLALYQSPWEILGGKYATAVAVPYLSVDVHGTLLLGPLSPTVSDQERSWRH